MVSVAIKTRLEVLGNFSRLLEFLGKHEMEDEAAEYPRSLADMEQTIADMSPVMLLVVVVRKL